MGRTGAASAALSALVLCALPACSGGGGEPPDPGPEDRLPAAITGQRPSWGPCRDLRARTGSPSRSPAPAPAPECATVTVPLDYSEPDGDTISLALIRARATGPGERIGSLVFNFGGPGGSGVDALAESLDRYERLRTRYDLVGLDPRGVGRSAPVTCVDDRRMDELTAMDDSPDNAAEERAFLDARLSYDKGCQARAGRVLPYVGTPSAARDLDVVRTVLGDARLHYFGISYGTWLGGSYAHQKPRTVGRAVLDGAVDTRIGDVELDLQQTAAFQRALGAFAASCAGQGTTACPLGRDGEQVLAKVGGILGGLDARPLPTGDPAGRTLTQSLGVTGVMAALYSADLWPVLREGLTEAADAEDGSKLLALADLQLGRRPDGRYTNSVAANTAITCADTAERHTLDQVRRLVPRFTKASPVFGPSMAWGLLQCTGWPVKGDRDAGEVSAPGAAPILVVGNTGDPATPYAWAPALTRELGGKAALLSLKGEGHGAYGTGNACVRKAVDRYLLEGDVPRNGTTCG
ncbi:alpha/beta hydrolase [Spirillospora sp. NPDC029432]|uniref:alpha/beta hydrolase n=1 Tax=Spirillospora sp. NPDC029432 TaxID=3154599 RepID=UPI003456A6CE